MIIRLSALFALLSSVFFLSGCASHQPATGVLERALSECESEIPVVNNSIELRITNNKSEQDSAACISNALNFDWDAIATRFNSGDESFVLTDENLELTTGRADDRTVIFKIADTSITRLDSGGETQGLLVFFLCGIGLGLVVGLLLSKAPDFVSSETLGALAVLGVLSPLLAWVGGLATDSDPLFWSEFNSWGGPTYGVQVFFVKILTGFLTFTGFASIAILLARRRDSKKDRYRRAEEVSVQLDSLFAHGVAAAVKEALAGFAKSVKNGDLQGEIAKSDVAIRGLLSPIEEMKRIASYKQHAHLNGLLQAVTNESISFQQDIWNSSLTSSLQFEMVLDEDVSFGFLEYDDEDGDWTIGNQISRWELSDSHGEFIQVRGERFIVGCNILQISSNTKVEAKQFDDEYTLSLELKVYDKAWAFELSAEDWQVDDWPSFTEKVGSLVDALRQVQRNLKVVDDQELAKRERKRIETQYMGVKFGDWQAIRPLGNGGFGQVWLGEKTILEGDVPKQQAAIKVFSRTDFQSLKQFQAEMSSLGQLRHPNIAQLLDNAKRGNTFWFATSFVGEYSLGEFLSEGRPVDRFLLQTYATQLFAALAHAHRRQMVHGDVHPGNLVLTNDQSAIVLIDFGLSAISGLRTQEALTNLAYRAPELLTEQPLVDVKNDIYSAAMTILTLARGSTPWKSHDIMALNSEVKAGSPSLQGVDESLARFLRPLLSRNPAMRPSASEVYNHLQRFGFHPW